MASSTYGVFLMKGTGTGTITYSKLVDIKDFPDLGGEPELLETTTLSDKSQTYIKGIQQQEAMPFTCNYVSATYDTIKALETAGTECDFAVYFGAGSSGQPDGHDGIFTFKGQISVYVSGKGVNEVSEMIVSIVPSTEITKAAASVQTQSENTDPT